MEFFIKSNKREELVDITKEVEKAVKNEEGNGNACLIYTPHTTCGIIVNENHDTALCEDIINYLKKNIPLGVWKHDARDGNADSHIKASIIGPSQVIPIENGKLQLGRWQGIALAEFDGPRERKIIIKII